MQTYLLLSGITLVAMASPGPDMLLLLRNSLTGGRRAGLATVLGIVGGLLIHVSLSVAGLAWLLTGNHYVYHALRLLGALYLIYIGIRSLRCRGSLELSPLSAAAGRTGRQGLRDGFLCNLLNPKVTLYIFSVFTQFIAPSDSLWRKGGFGLVIVLTSLLGWSLFVLLVQNGLVRRALARGHLLLERLFGSLMVALGLRIALLRD
ncbi:LysE family translocator [Desulfuromonas sp. CSMB_57]|jgi:threonine/homoserine/homoserine lactone efflux protein|uniref:LysE family translocator n=1 Tax=Desulfuromonas sp. CSMB_57 TaxID=2807629 RepID=UPI001CD46D32|nr:LysE family translocator [Desulfuromonas sp. CSMB_57]